ncbi:CHAP domain-containing protein [Luteococcus peritonei]|uniref:CHAP domain-containing protein n=1 Tax=Luteococcus peritonei TaxID=88874 RepID=A0ABW4RUE7_9ACTN
MTPARHTAPSIRRRLGAALALSGSLVAACLTGAASAQAATTAGTGLANSYHGYPHPLAKDCSEVPGDLTGCVPDRWDFFQGQCVSWVAHRLNTRSGVPMTNIGYRGQRWSHGGRWDDAARRAGIRVDSIPAVGAVAYWDRSVGHVAYVEAVNPDGSVLVSEMNRDNHNSFHRSTLTRSVRWPNGFIHFKDLPATSQQYRVDRGGALWLDSLSASGVVSSRRAVGNGWLGMGLLTQLDDLTGDGWPELVARSNADGRLFLYPSTGGGRLGARRQVGNGWGAARSLTDSGPRQAPSAQRHLVAVFSGGRVVQYNLSRTGLTQGRQLVASSRLVQVTSPGDVTGDSRADLLGVDSSGRLLLHPTTATGLLGSGRQVGQGWGSYQVASHRSGVLTALSPSGQLTTRGVTATGLRPATSTATGLTGQRIG